MYSDAGKMVRKRASRTEKYHCELFSCSDAWFSGKKPVSRTYIGVSNVNLCSDLKQACVVTVLCELDENIVDSLLSSSLKPVKLANLLQAEQRFGHFIAQLVCLLWVLV